MGSKQATKDKPMGVTITYRGDKYKTDEFFKSLLFQAIMDEDLTRNERDTLLVVSRKTFHYNKPSDRLGIHFLAKAVGIGTKNLRITIESLEEKKLLIVDRSKGGQHSNANRFHSFALSGDILIKALSVWIKAKESKGFGND